MAKLEFLDSESEEYFDILVEVGFKNNLSPTQVLDVMQIILNTYNDKVTLNLRFEGISFLQLSANSLVAKFRQLTVANPRFNKSSASEDDSRFKMQFIFYLFAKIDSQYPLGDIPFPPNFREFIILPEYL